VTSETKGCSFFRVRGIANQQQGRSLVFSHLISSSGSKNSSSELEHHDASSSPPSDIVRRSCSYGPTLERSDPFLGGAA
jgi:hypothetical protein